MADITGSTTGKPSKNPEAAGQRAASEAPAIGMAVQNQPGSRFMIRVPSVRQVPSGVTQKHGIENFAYISRVRGLLSIAR